MQGQRSKSETNIEYRDPTWSAMCKANPPFYLSRISFSSLLPQLFSSFCLFPFFLSTFSSFQFLLVALNSGIILVLFQGPYEVPGSNLSLHTRQVPYSLCYLPDSSIFFLSQSQLPGKPSLRFLLEQGTVKSALKKRLMRSGSQI